MEEDGVGGSVCEAVDAQTARWISCAGRKHDMKTILQPKLPVRFVPPSGKLSAFIYPRCRVPFPARFGLRMRKAVGGSGIRVIGKN
jgi:hypothetical protein